MVTLPDVSGLPCDSLSGPDGAEYMRRYYRNRGPGPSFRFHRIITSDPGRVLHDHPWDFVSQLLEGCYIEHTLRGEVVYRAPCVIRRRAEMPHRLELPEGEVWTYVVTGRPRRRWGFWTARGWVHWRDYPGAGAAAACADEQDGAARW